MKYNLTNKIPCKVHITSKTLRVILACLLIGIVFVAIIMVCKNGVQKEPNGDITSNTLITSIVSTTSTNSKSTTTIPETITEKTTDETNVSEEEESEETSNDSDRTEANETTRSNNKKETTTKKKEPSSNNETTKHNTESPNTTTTQKQPNTTSQPTETPDKPDETKSSNVTVTSAAGYEMPAGGWYSDDVCMGRCTYEEYRANPNPGLLSGGTYIAEPYTGEEAYC